MRMSLEGSMSCMYCVLCIMQESGAVACGVHRAHTLSFIHQSIIYCRWDTTLTPTAQTGEVGMSWKSHSPSQVWTAAERHGSSLLHLLLLNHHHHHHHLLHCHGGSVCVFVGLFPVNTFPKGEEFLPSSCGMRRRCDEKGEARTVACVCVCI
ncbi:uncharacterized protein K489DRAFT_112685 [Dissoconium aciculare CBS 342.82]|uniref:Uncharacterized protein n=1 Tax=Dissoconium aciculare CBS 342.82 TaxID=1314786 RepID=A0A6J3MEL3_9PEZI|nr:uncharacterized protein K489DRAFT_112685 [Dissoconium aciculare CBS 342.82]KAF1826323.1 hypothetical protein K489DRAFT_112685 [Dissoconium aciculare CBS 342.82]